MTVQLVSMQYPKAAPHLPPSLGTISDELVLHICSFVDDLTLPNLAQTSQRLCKLASRVTTQRDVNLFVDFFKLKVGPFIDRAPRISAGDLSALKQQRLQVQTQVVKFVEGLGKKLPALNSDDSPPFVHQDMKALFDFFPHSPPQCTWTLGYAKTGSFAEAKRIILLHEPRERYVICSVIARHLAKVNQVAAIQSFVDLVPSEDWGELLGPLIRELSDQGKLSEAQHFALSVDNAFEKAYSSYFYGCISVVEKLYEKGGRLEAEMFLQQIPHLPFRDRLCVNIARFCFPGFSLPVEDANLAKASDFLTLIESPETRCEFYRMIVQGVVQVTNRSSYERFVIVLLDSLRHFADWDHIRNVMLDEAANYGKEAQVLAWMPL